MSELRKPIYNILYRVGTVVRMIRTRLGLNETERNKISNDANWIELDHGWLRTVLDRFGLLFAHDPIRLDQ